ncbi:MAG: phage tail sheath family protein, partial [Nannocystaceae bacterium]
SLTAEAINTARESTYGALYFPWIDVSGKGAFVPPSGHIAGMYARVDATRGVHKAPANEVIRGALDLKYRIGKPIQDGLNPEGVNALRVFGNTVKVWGARTLKKNNEFTYINIRRLFNFLRESIEEGLQWAVFEPNDTDLWAKVSRNTGAFLTNVWSSGALFGNNPEEAFFVKCDDETNPPEVRDLGQVVTEIGVSVTKPAEFVIFRLSQKTQSG